ncbi:MAG: hypothetical protein LBU22_12675 [Dysgonamonadaceae bacterium]|jgi:hypothetical protein|nr:hypothetical protein [Dysgonamonadaceae bacterium]
MRAEKIIDLMTGTAYYNEDTLSQLSAVIDEFPFFQAAHLLYALNFLELKDTHFSIELRKTAAYLNDRKKLFYLVEDAYFKPETIALLERKEEKAVSSFDLLELFLKDKDKDTNQSSMAGIDYVSHYLSDDAGNDAPASPPLQHQEAIDKFLKEGAHSLVKFNLNDTEVGVESHDRDLDTVDENSFFSETLAKIYIKQKKYGRALTIIRKLNLLYPEKNRYFADQIRFLEKLIINTKNL